MDELPFDHPDVQTAFETAFEVLVIESDRGAVLVAAELISNTLGKFLQGLFPVDFDSTTFLKYPGPLSSMSARAEAAYAFRLISKDLYRAINLIRRARNDAAHSPTDFSLEAQGNRLREAYEATVTPWTSINHMARRLMAFRLVEVFRNVDGDPARKYSREELVEMLESPEVARHFPKYQLAVAVSLICAMITYYKLKLLPALEGGALIAKLLRPEEADDRQDPNE